MVWNCQSFNTKPRRNCCPDWPTRARRMCNIFTPLTTRAPTGSVRPSRARVAPRAGRGRILDSHELRTPGSPTEVFGGMRMRYRLSGRTAWLSALSLVLLMVLVALPWGVVRSADHRDSPLSSQDPSADINDVYVFVNPLDSTKVI